MCDEKKITWEVAKAMLEKEYPHGVDLVYIDYRDHLSDKMVAKIVETGFCETADENDWMCDARYESMNTVCRELFEEYDIEDIEDDICDWFSEHDTSTPLKDLMSNTRPVLGYYKLGYEVDSSTYNDSWLKEGMSMLKKVLGPNVYRENEKDLILMLQESYYGGDLVILFNVDASDFQGELKDKYITFTDPVLCVMDRLNGSGYYERIKGTVQVPLCRDRLRVDSVAPGYGIDSVFGGTRESYHSDYKMSSKRKGRLIKVDGEGGYSDAEKREMEYDRKWNEERKCTFGDMKISRHARTTYRNEYPCGSKCEECGTFWID